MCNKGRYRCSAASEDSPAYRSLSTGASTAKLEKLQWPTLTAAPFSVHLNPSGALSNSMVRIHSPSTSLAQAPHMTPLLLTWSSPGGGWQAALITALQLPSNGIPFFLYRRNPFATLNARARKATRIVVRRAIGEKPQDIVVAFESKSIVSSKV